MAKRKSTAEDLFDIITDICFYLPVWAVLLTPFIFGGGTFWLLNYLIYHKFQTIFPAGSANTLIFMCTLFAFALSGMAAFKGYMGRKQRKTLLTQTQSLDELKNLSWREFELLIAEVYRSEGYQVTEMGGSAPDGGIDLTAKSSSGQRYLIQCKHYKTSKVGVKIVREMLGVLAKEGADHAVVIATGAYTKDAIEFAKGQAIELIDGPSLIKRIQTYNQQATDSNSDAFEADTIANTNQDTTEPENIDKICPKCGSKLVERTAKRGPNAGNTFWGCSNFPKCRYTE